MERRAASPVQAFPRAYGRDGKRLK